MTKTNIEQRLEIVESEIAEVLQRLPAHSVKPPVMHELLDLEDERDSLRNLLEQLLLPD